MLCDNKKCLSSRQHVAGSQPKMQEEEEERGGRRRRKRKVLFKADAVNEEDPERGGGRLFKARSGLGGGGGLY